MASHAGVIGRVRSPLCTMAAQCHRKCCLRAVGDGSTLWAPTSSQPVATPAHVGGGEKCVSRTQPLTLVAAADACYTFCTVTFRYFRDLQLHFGSCRFLRQLPVFARYRI